jgi:hypothetical protein
MRRKSRAPDLEELVDSLILCKPTYGSMLTAPMIAAWPAVIAIAWLPPQQQTPPPPPPPPAVPTQATPAPTRPAAPAITAPVLPVDARRLVDQTTQQLLDQLLQLQERYLADKRPEDAAAVRTQIQLLRQVTGLPEDPAGRADHVNMVQYRDRVGQSFVFTITGSADQPVWGSGVYTDDTRLEGAAVHAGVLRSGQTGPVRVTVLGGQAQYVGSKRNGVESASFGPSNGSYRIETGPGSASRPTSIASFRGRFGEVVTVPAIGSATGSVWGSDIYTDDSALGSAAVHAGILRPGEFGFLRVTMLGGQASYPGTSRNGVTSQEYGEWSGSFKLAEAPQPWVIRLPEDVVDASGMVSLPSLRKQIGVSFSLVVVGASGPVRGSDVYTDDSSIGAAAVHAGVLLAGERGYVRVTVLPGQHNYAGSLQNGVRSADAGEWGGSFSIARGSGR